VTVTTEAMNKTRTETTNQPHETWQRPSHLKTSTFYTPPVSTHKHIFNIPTNHTWHCENVKWLLYKESDGVCRTGISDKKREKSVTCHIGSHGHLPQTNVNAPRLNPWQADQYSTHLP